MKFLDEIKIFVKSGSGGSGCCSFRREKFIEYGGPDGGNGGKGGDVIIKCSNSLNTLIDYKYKQHCIAKDGKPGMGKKKAGKNGNDFIVNIPIGTEILMDDKKTLIKDLSKENDQIIIAFGGNGGSGNINYKSSTNRAPRKFTKGEKGEEKWLYLKLKLIADIGIVGLPNAGKSSFIKKISNAKPKIGDYPFTTITPNLANVIINNIEITFADIPGIIEGAAEGKGLGLRFLRHIERNSTLLFLVPADSDDITKEYKILLGELQKYNPELLDKDRILAVSKSDMLDDELKAEIEKELPKDIPSLFISSVAQQGLTELKDLIWQKLNE